MWKLGGTKRAMRWWGEDVMSRWFDGKVFEGWHGLNSLCSAPLSSGPGHTSYERDSACVEKRHHVKEKRQSDNCTESEQCSWESWFPRRRRGGRLKRLFIFHLQMETEECWGWSQRYNWLEMGLLGLLSCPPPPTPVHFPSPTFLIFTRALPRSLWEKAERKKRSRATHSPCHLRLPHSQTRFIPHSCGLRSSAALCSAAAASGTAEPRTSPGSSQICLPVCGKHSVLSHPSSLTAFPSRSRVIKKELLILPSVPSGVFLSLFHFCFPSNQRHERLGWHLYSARTRLNYWGGSEVELHKLCEAASPWPGAGMPPLSWELMKDCLSAPCFS